MAGFFFEIAVCEVKKDTDTYFNLYVISAGGQRSPGPPDRGSDPGQKEGCQGWVQGVVRGRPDVWTHGPVRLLQRLPHHAALQPGRPLDQLPTAPQHLQQPAGAV